MQIEASELYKQAVDLVYKGENLHLASDQFNRLLNNTIHGEGDAATLLFHIACVNMKQQNHAMAIILFRLAIEHHPEFTEAINNLGYVYRSLQMIDEARKCFEEVLKLVEKNKDIIPANDHADYLTNIGSLLVATGAPDEALAYFNKAQEVAPTNDVMKWNRSLVLLEKGEYEQGFYEYDFGDRNKVRAERNYGIKDLPEWDGKTEGEIIVFGEQGIGDELMFISILAELLSDEKYKNHKFILDAHPRLKDLFTLNFPTIPVYGTRKTECKHIGWVGYHKPVAKIALGSLCKFFRKKEEDFPKTPYIAANPDIAEIYAQRFIEMSSRPKIGISWRGGTKLTNKEERHIKLDLWLPILKTIDADFISLQYDKDIKPDVEKFCADNGVTIHHWQDAIDDYDQTAGLVQNLDLVISVPQSVVHLAGAMGIPTLQLTPFRAMWQMGVNGKDMPWYGCVKNYWQEKGADWVQVMETVRADLCNLLAMNTES